MNQSTLAGMETESDRRSCETDTRALCDDPTPRGVIRAALEAAVPGRAVATWQGSVTKLYNAAAGNCATRMIAAYANRTGTIRNLDAMTAAGWGLLVCANTRGSSNHRTEGFADYMLDNAAYKCRKKGDDPQARLDYWEATYLEPFEALVEQHGQGARLVVAPDIYCGGALSLATSARWSTWLLGEVPGVVLIPVQDGMTAEQLAPLLGPRVGLAVGGSTEWKWRTLAAWCWLAREHGAHCHVLRANSARMVSWASSCGASSFDGSGPSKFADCLRRVDAGRAPVQMTAPGLELSSPFTPREGVFR